MRRLLLLASCLVSLSAFVTGEAQAACAVVNQTSLAACPSPPFNVPIANNYQGYATTIANPGVFTNAAMNTPNTFMLNGASALTEFQISHPGNYSTQAVAGGVVVPSGSTVYDSAAVAGYVNNGSSTTSGTAGEFYVRSSITGAHNYAINPLVVDGTSATNYASTLVGAEFDIGAFNLSSIAYGSNMIGVFPNGTPGTAVAYQVAVLNSPWQFGFLTGDGAAVTAIQLGAQALAANSDGQPINLVARDATSTIRECVIQAQHQSAGANLAVNCPTGGLVLSGSMLVSGAASFSNTVNVAGVLGMANAISWADGASANALEVGSLATAANSDGQPFTFNVRDNANTTRSCTFQGQHATAGANLAINCPTGGMVISGTFLVSGAGTFQTGVQFTGSGTGLAVTNNETVGGTLNVTGATVMAGGLSFSGTLPTGTAATYACFTSGGVIISSASPC